MANVTDPALRQNRINDYLTNFRFHVMDITMSVPQVFNLSFGFKYVSSPSISLDVKEVKEGTFEYPRKLIRGAKVEDVVLHRGVKFFDSDFYDWISTAVKGGARGGSTLGSNNLAFRRNLLLIQYSDITTGLPATNSTNGTPFAAFSFTAYTSLVNFVPARAWRMYDCLPVGYKAATDFDALASEISIAELTVSPRYIEEINTGL
jgi:phage tail-like protein